MNSAVFSLTPGPSPRGRGAKENRRKFLLQYLTAGDEQLKPARQEFATGQWIEVEDLDELFQGSEHYELSAV